MFYLTKAAAAHMKPGSAIINTASINSDTPNPTLLAYATTGARSRTSRLALRNSLLKKGSAPMPSPLGPSGHR